MQFDFGNSTTILTPKVVIYNYYTVWKNRTS